MQTVGKEVVKLVETQGRLFPNGTAVELVRDHSGILKLLAWDGESAKIVDRFKDGDTMITSPQLPPLVTDCLALPSGVADFGSTRKLFGQIAELISRACGGNDRASIPFSFFVFASWLSDKAPVAPFLWVVVPPTCSSAALKQMLRLLCRHAFVVNTLTTSWPGSIPMSLNPTLIAEVDSQSRSALSLLRASQTHGINSARGSQCVDIFCSKVIFAREPLRDAASAGFPLEIVLPQAGEYAPPLDFADAARLADKFQNQLLGYRLANFSKVTPPTFELGTYSAPTKAMAHAVAGSIVGDNDLQTQLVPFLQELEADIQTDRTMELNAMILEALLTRWTEDEVGDAEIVGDLNTIIAGRGGGIQFSPETVGWKLKGLGIRTTTISRGLRGVKMADARHSIRRIATAYGLSVPEDPSSPTRPTLRPRQGRR